MRGRRGLPAHVATCAGCRSTCTAEAVECTVIGGDAGVSSFFLGGGGKGYLSLSLHAQLAKLVASICLGFPI